MLYTIWGSLVCVLPVCWFSTAWAQNQSEGWKELFDGRSLQGWRHYDGRPIEGGWVAERGTLFLKEPGCGSIITELSFPDFELELEWKISPEGNSGIMYLVNQGDPAPYYSGPEYQIVDDQVDVDADHSKTSAGSLYGLVAPRNKTVRPVGQYNQARILVKDRHIDHWLNGIKILSIDIDSDQWKKLVAQSKFCDWESFAASNMGHIALQDHGDQVWYRNLRLRELPDKSVDR